jgi:hypothetical protein
MKPIEQFRKHGLARPIRARAGILSWLFLILGGPFLVGGSLFALVRGGLFEQAVGAFGLVFFGFCFLIYADLLVRSRSRGMLAFSERGIYHALYGLELDWSDVGPAWIYQVAAAGSHHGDVMFVLRNASKYRRQLGSLGKFLFSVMVRQASSRRGGALETGLKAFGAFAGGADVGNALEEMRQRLAQEDDAIALGIPRIIRFGLSNEDVTEIINTTILQRGTV